MLRTKLQMTWAGVLGAALLGTGAAAGQEPQQRREPSVLPPGIDRLELSEAQKSKLARVQAEFEAKLDTAKKQHAEAIEQARQNQDRQKAQEADQALRKEVAQLLEQVQGQLRELLTEEQRQRLGELQRAQAGAGRPGADLRRLLSQLELSEEQREKVQALIKELGEKQAAAQKEIQEALEKAKENQDRAKVREILEGQQKAMAKLQDELHTALARLLNDEQKRRLGELQRQRPGAAPSGLVQVLPPPLQERLGLSDEQRAKIAGLQKELEGRLREILTEEQNRRVEEIRRGEAPAPRQRPKE
jgi:hypothetical protein